MSCPKTEDREQGSDGAAVQSHSLTSSFEQLQAPDRSDPSLPYAVFRMPHSAAAGGMAEPIKQNQRAREAKPFCRRQDGGADRDRTDDLKLAKLALSQLSYGPIRMSDVREQMSEKIFRHPTIWHLPARKAGVVGPGGVEPPTSRLSGVRSNHLSYEPLSDVGYQMSDIRRVRNANARLGCQTTKSSVRIF